MKIYAFINSLFCILYGLYGVLMPAHLGKYVTGWTPDLLGLHQIRATWMSYIGLGVVIFVVAQKGHLIGLTKAIVFLTLCFTAGRFVALVMDGAGPTQTYQEIGVEIISATIGILLLARAKRQAA
jgi:hypothetical protein